jgi:AcrR family transcriptional regulator
MKRIFVLRASDYLQNFRAVSDASSIEGKAAEKPGMKQRLIDAARAEFGERGIEAATTRGIAERAGCNEVTLFRHFESKQKLLAAVVQETSEEFVALCECREVFTGDADLERFATVYTGSLDRCMGMARALIGEGNRRPTLCKELVGNVIEPFHESIACYLNQQKQEGWVRGDLDTLAFAEVFTAALFGGELRRTSGLSGLDRESWIRETVSVFVRGIEAQEQSG